MQNKTLNSFKYVVPALIIAAICLVFSAESYAVPASPDVHEYVQPDGRVLNVRVKGDEWNNWLETVDGYSIEKNQAGYLEYVDHYDGGLPVLSGVNSHEAPPLGIEKHIKRSSDFVSRYPEETALYSPNLAPVGPFSGPVLFILAEFTNKSGTYSEASFASFITNNISDYFNEASYGIVNLTPANETSGIIDNGVIGWINVGPTHPNTGGSIGTANQQLTKDAIVAADQFIDFSAYDIDPPGGDGYVDAHELAVVIIAAGFERAYSTDEPNVWGHRWNLDAVTPPNVDGVIVGADNGRAGGYAQFGEIHANHQATMGIMVHELGHLIFGLPDLYDTPPDNSSEGIGAFGLMGAGSWGKSSADTYGGETPVLPCAWSKYDRGWIIAPISGIGTVSIEAAGSASATAVNSAYRVLTSLPNEYFLVENRQPVGYDRGLERTDWLGVGFGGLAIWHIDDNTISSRRSTNTINNSECYPGGPSCSPNHYGVALVQADALWHLEVGSNKGNATDLWYASNQPTFCSDTMPNSDLWNSAPSGVSITNIGTSQATMTADFLDLSAPSAPTGLTANTVSASRIDLSWTDSSICEDEFKIERKTGSGGTYTEITTVNAGITMYENSGLSGSTEYYYRVIASNTAGDSVPSIEDNATTFASPPAAAASSGGGGGGGCFIATAAYGSYMADEVIALREFRDTYLMTNTYGRAFVNAYYKYSPPIADVIKENEFLKTFTRAFLTPVVMGIAYPYHSLVIFIAFLFAAIALRVRRKKGLTV